MAYARRDVVGGAIVTTLSAGITSGDMTFVLGSATGWPTGANGDFFVVLDRGNAGEEKIRCASRTGTTCTVQASGRGADGTSAAAHTSGVSAEHCLTALDLDEANYAVAKTVGLVAAQGDILVGSAANTLVKLAKGTSGLPLVAGASTVSYATIGTSAYAAGSVDTAALGALSVTSAKIVHEAMTSWTPTITSGTGTLTTTSATGKWYRIGLLIFYHLQVTITTNGTGATAIVFTPPVTASFATADYIGSGRELVIAGKALQVVLASNSLCNIYNYDNSYPASSGAILAVSGFYEAAT